MQLPPIGPFKDEVGPRLQGWDWFKGTLVPTSQNLTGQESDSVGSRLWAKFIYSANTHSVPTLCWSLSWGYSLCHTLLKIAPCQIHNLNGIGGRGGEQEGVCAHLGQKFQKLREVLPQSPAVLKLTSGFWGRP